jgi:hypothetical protein
MEVLNRGQFKISHPCEFLPLSFEKPLSTVKGFLYFSNKIAEGGNGNVTAYGYHGERVLFVPLYPCRLLLARGKLDTIPSLNFSNKVVGLHPDRLRRYRYDRCFLIYVAEQTAHLNNNKRVEWLFSSICGIMNKPQGGVNVQIF